MNKKTTTVVVVILMMVLAFGIMLYPIISTAYNEAHQSEILTQHRQEVAQLPNERIAEMRENAENYNSMLQPITQEDYTSEMLEEAAENYKNQLDLVGDGIMGYIEIPKIHVYLPIYHGTNDATLEIGVGHLLGSSLPIGGKGTHSVLTAHSGMVSNKMFSDLPQLKKGDTFFLHVMDSVQAYQVEAIFTVLPHDTTHLGIDKDNDFCTLVTCTPFGINTHRLLVRGSRVPYVPTENEQCPTESVELRVTSKWEQEYLKGIGYGVAIVVIMFTIYAGCKIWRHHHEER